jgi:type II secretory pathway component GspD/PulD (secretin)
MTRATTLALLCSLLALGGAAAQDDKSAPAPPAAAQRAVYHVKYADAAQLAQVAGLHFKGEATVLAAPAGSGNALLVSGSAAAVPEVVKLLEQLDRKPRAVEIEVTLAEVAAKDWKEGETPAEDAVRPGTLQRIKLTATEGQPVASTTGANKPVVSGEGAGGGRGGFQRSITYVPTGTKVKLTARVGAGDAVLVDLSVQEDRVRPADAGDAAGAAAVENATLTTKVSVPANKSVVAQAVRTGGKNGPTVAVVIVTARVVDSGSASAKKP